MSAALWSLLPVDAWSAVSAHCALGDLVRARACSSDSGAASALSAALARLTIIDLGKLLPSREVLKAVWSRCPALESTTGLHCSGLLSKQRSESTGSIDGIGQETEVGKPATISQSVVAVNPSSKSPLPELPLPCRKLALRFDDAWSSSESAEFVVAAAVWLQRPLEHLAVAWNPTASGGRAEETVQAAAEMVATDWRLPAARSLSMQLVPPVLGTAILHRALSDGAQLRSVHLVDTVLPPAGSSFWRVLEEFFYRCDSGARGIDDSFLAHLGAAAPRLKMLRLVDQRRERNASIQITPCVSTSGLQSLRPLLSGLHELRLARICGPLCCAPDIDLLMLLSCSLGPDLRRLHLEGFPRLSDAALIEMLSLVRADGEKGLEALRLLGTGVTDAAFVNGLCDALRPSLRELRLSGNPGVTDTALGCLAEGGRCSKLDRLALGGGGFGDTGISDVLSEAHALRCLYLIDCSISDETFAKLVVETPRLQDLGIAGCTALSEQGLLAMQGLPLQSLRIDSCTRISNHAMSQFLQEVGPKLSSLSIERCNGLGNACLHPLRDGACWGQLQHFRLVGIKVSGIVLTWCNAETTPRLRRLEIWREHWPRCFTEAKATFRSQRPEVVLAFRRHGTLGWNNW